jgi:hypothetical protein
MVFFFAFGFDSSALFSVAALSVFVVLSFVWGSSRGPCVVEAANPLCGRAVAAGIRRKLLEQHLEVDRIISFSVLNEFYAIDCSVKLSRCLGEL